MYLDGEDDLLDLEKLDPAFTDYIRQCQYVMYPDLADALKPGRHCLAAIVASGWRDNPGVNRLLNVNDGNVAEFMGQPCLTAMLRLTYQDGREELIVTDETWQCGHGGYQFASVFDGTVYDAREDAPEWNLPDFKGNFLPRKVDGSPRRHPGLPWLEHHRGTGSLRRARSHPDGAHADPAHH